MTESVRRIYLHVGAPKTGTSFVQDILFNHRAELREQGILYAADRHDAHFLAALDLMDLPWGGLEQEATGAWDRLAAEVRAWPGTAIISHEILGFASRVHVERALASLGDAEVHVVLSARDLVRQIPAEWQENVKHRRTLRYGAFLDELRDEKRSGDVARWFWGVQEVPDVLERWTAGIPSEHVHVVTVPPPGSAPNLLWERFAGVFGLDPVKFAPGDRVNTSLGVPESAMVRRLNTRLNDVLPNHHYRGLVRELLVHQNLSARSGSPRLALSPEAHAWAAGLGRSWVTELVQRGYDVVGDLDELLPSDPGPFTDPDACDEAAVADAAIEALALMTREAARLRDVESELREVVADRDREIQRLRSTGVHRAKERFVQKAETSTLARGSLAVYRRLRGRNSRST
ncbi:MAG TPA: hypothetical protein VFJ28_05445 [Marmoricola sp.]|nr:hypothetical protein [Marmoricola sp.]